MKKHLSKKDYEALTYLIKKYNIKSIFEIGTWEGATTLFLYNQSNVKKVKTIDIYDEMEIAYNNRSHPLQPKEFYGKYIKDTNVEIQFCDSMTYKSKKGEQYDMVFIDGNHDYEYVKNDTELALKLKPKIIVWHDYGGGAIPVINYINELKSEGKKIKKYADNSLIAYMKVKK